MTTRSLREVSHKEIRSYEYKELCASISCTLWKLSFPRELMFQLQNEKKVFLKSPGFNSTSLDKSIFKKESQEDGETDKNLLRRSKISRTDEADISDGTWSTL